MNTLQEDQDNSLTLGLGFSSSPPSKPTPKPQQLEEPSLTLTLSGGEPCSGAGSVSVVSVKRERESGSSDDVDGDGDGEADRGFSRVGGSDEDDNSGGTRKKLRLTKQQSAMLEDSFKLQSTLNPKQKQALAERLSLRPRQVEVWFQNRRARTKLKQTEVDCEYLKKYCETLTEENRRLEKEVQELKALKLASPFYMHVPAATLTMCPSCERVGAGGSPNTATTTVPTVPKNAFSLGPQTHHFLAATPNNCPLLVDN